MTDRDVGSRAALSVGDDEQGQLRSTMDDAARQTGETAQQLAGKVRETGEQQATQQKQRAAQGLATIAEALRDASHRASEQEQGGVEQITRFSADQAERLSAYLGEADVGEMVGQAEDFARNQPAIFLAGAFTVGLLGARLLKAGMPDDRGQGQERGREQRYGYGYQQSYAGGRGASAGVSDQWSEPVSQSPGYEPAVQRRETGV